MIVGVATVMAFGEKKYGRDNWRKGMAWTELCNSALRHLLAFTNGQDKDPESNLLHLDHAAACVGFLRTYIRTHPELDDRYKETE